MKKAYIIHGWSGNPEEGWFPWLKTELEGRGFEVLVPEMPETNYPKIEKWVPFLSDIVGVPDENTFLIGHSIGCQTIMRMAEILPEGSKIGGVIFVAPWLNLPNLSEKEKPIGAPWLDTPIDFEDIKNKINKIIAIFSDDDPDVPLSDKDLFEKYLGAEIIVEKTKGHFTGEDGIIELPSALDSILKISN